MKKTPLETELTEYLIPTKFPARVVALDAQPIFTAVQLTNATPKEILNKFEIITTDGLRWTETGVAFLKTERGYMKADKNQFILLDKHITDYVYEDVESVLIITPSFFYTGVDFNKTHQTTQQTLRGERIAVHSVEWTDSGVPRLKTSRGYLTASKDYVSTNSKFMAYAEFFIRWIVKNVKKCVNKIKHIAD